MQLPPQGSNGVCEAWVQLEEAEDHSLGTLIGGAGQRDFHICQYFPFLGSQKFCGLTVPNYPGPSVIMSGKLLFSIELASNSSLDNSGSNSLTVNYYLPETSLSHGHGFEVIFVNNLHCIFVYI